MLADQDKISGSRRSGIGIGTSKSGSKTPTKKSTSCQSTSSSSASTSTSKSITNAAASESIAKASKPIAKTSSGFGKQGGVRGGSTAAPPSLDLDPPPCFDPTADNYKNTSFDNVDVDNDGNPLGLFGIPWNKIKGKDLRPLAKSFGVRNYGQMKKEILIKRLVAAFINKDMYDAEAKDSSRRQKQCPF